MVAFYYKVKAKVVLYSKESGEIEFLVFEKEFKNDEPIIARESAFEYYQKNIEYFLESKHKKYYSDKQARDELKSFTEVNANSELIFGVNPIEYEKAIGNGIGIFLIENNLDEEREIRNTDDSGIFIHGIGDRWFIQDYPDFIMSDLEVEYELYNKFGYKTGNKKTEILYCSVDEWIEGYLGDGKWVDESYIEPQIRTILHTPFDWSGLDIPYWWEDSKNEKSEIITKLPQKLNELLKDGESNQVEFKSALMFNFLTGKAGISIKGIIAKAICAFLNSNGGFLVIGLTDKGEVQGLSHDFSLSQGKKEKDFFMLEFDQMLEHFLSFSVKNNVSGQFYQLEEKDIFVVTVSPSKQRPIFLKGQNGKEFYVRGEASSRQIIDIEQLANYCIEKWGK